MTFRTKSRAVEVSTESGLGELVDAALRSCERFALEKAAGHSLSVTEYDHDGLILQLHRGKKYDAWLASRKPNETRAILMDYYHEPLTASGEIEKRGEWREVGVFPPAVYVVILIAIALVVLAIFLLR